MHLQPIFRECEITGGDVAAELFQYGLCLPSGSNLRESELERVVGAVLTAHAEGKGMAADSKYRTST
jgi:pyridoxal phosphate-dependent aminotransferase EpsN